MLRKRKYLLTVLSLVMLAIFLFPIYWMIITALKPQATIFAYPPQFFPRQIDWSIWRTVLERTNVALYLKNSSIVGFGTTFLTLILAAPAAYGVAQLPIKGKGAIILVSLSSLMFPVVMLATPLFVIFSQLSLTDSYIGLIFANTAISLPFALVVLRPFFLSLPRELSEAASIDGCSAWGAFIRIMLPLAVPGLVTAGVFTFLFGWNDLVFAITLTNNDQFRPITAGLWTFIGRNNTDWNGVMAFSTLAMLPPLLVFLIAQRYVVSGLTAGSVK